MTWLYHSLCNLARSSFISMTVRERRPCVLNTPSWRSKRLLTQDDTLQTFSWPYDTGALIIEMKHMSGIIELYEKVQQPTDMTGYFAMPMHFEDAFIDSHEFLVELLRGIWLGCEWTLDTLRTAWPSRWCFDRARLCLRDAGTPHTARGNH